MTRLIQLAICLVALLSTGAALTAETAAPTAHVYVQTEAGVMVYAAASNGKLTLVSSKLPIPAGDIGGINASHLMLINPYYVYVFGIGSNGSTDGKIVSFTSLYQSPGACGLPTDQGAVLDHTGKYLFMQLNSDGDCAAWQTFQIQSNGSLLSKGSEVYFKDNEAGNAVSSSVPTITADNKFGYGVFPVTTYDSDIYFCINFYQFCPQFSGFARNSNEALIENTKFTHSDPVAWTDFTYYPYVFSNLQADPSNHLAAVVNQLNGTGDADFPQLASYIINSTTGAISSTNTYSNMPYVGVGYVNNSITTHMSPSGLLLAVAGHPGLQIFHFNGAKPITKYSSVLLPTIGIDQVQWDQNNHLYALSYGSSELYVYTVTPTSITQASGSPYKLPSSPNGNKGLVVTWK